MFIVKKNRASKHLQVKRFLLSSMNINVFAMFLNKKQNILSIFFFSATIYISLNKANVPLSTIISDIHLFYKFTKLNLGRHILSLPWSMASFHVGILCSISSILKIVQLSFVIKSSGLLSVIMTVGLGFAIEIVDSSGGEKSRILFKTRSLPSKSGERLLELDTRNGSGLCTLFKGFLAFQECQSRI